MTAWPLMGYHWPLARGVEGLYFGARALGASAFRTGESAGVTMFRRLLVLRGIALAAGV